MVEQALLFDLNIDIETRVVLVKIDVRNPVNLPGSTAHVAIDVRVLVPRMGVIDDERGQNYPCNWLPGT